MIATVNRRVALRVGAAVAGIPYLLFSAKSSSATSTAYTLTTGPFVEVETTNGKLRGGHSRGALAFKGIPYAGPVSGKGRFKEAPPAASWSGVRDALRLGPPSMQGVGTTGGEDEPPCSENCLVLNVWTPAMGDGRKRPVMFYCHGGAYSIGSAGAPGQDGSRLAATYDVVVVASNHRLGLLGFLYLGEFGDEEYATSGNQGILDLIAALRWVRINIEAFGGDPNNIMVFGESGGGFKTGTLLAMPKAHGLFHKASIESGAALRRMTRDNAIKTTRRVLQALDIAPSMWRKLIDVPAETLVAVQLNLERSNGLLAEMSSEALPVGAALLHSAGYYFEQPGSLAPVVDGTYLPVQPFDPVAPEISSAIPLIVGYNRNEATFFNMKRPDTFKMDNEALVARLQREFSTEAQRILSVYRHFRPDATPSELYIAIATARLLGNDSIITAERKSRQSAPVYSYRYDYQSNLAIPGTSYKFGAGHASEIAMKFFNFDIPGLQGDGPGIATASHNMSEMWTNFARTNRPYAFGQPEWPPYDIERRATMLIDVNCSVAHDPNRQERELWQSRSI
ncbi:MAG: carboxylesterase/lipase family protein [Alphaproteobacteria bacterium]|nr:carboxylesterase/lipase family protein [Alphaproteobacteria bacterium]MDE2496143.1 carboxylesterase/lipase family protein [Alphaproteobacteria bacterium]